MKNHLLFSLLLCFSVVHLAAQSAIGLKAGINASYQNLPSILDLEDETNSGLIRGQIGLSFKQQITPAFSIYSDLAYTQMGGEFEYFFTDFFGERIKERVTTKLNYLSMQLMLQYHLLERVSLDIGGQLGYLTDDNDAVLEPADWDAGIVLGSTFTIFDMLDFQFRYYLGLTTTQSFEFTDQNGEPTGEAKFKNRSLQFSLVFYPLQFGKS